MPSSTQEQEKDMKQVDKGIAPTKTTNREEIKS